jgi:hypothetical protein
MKKTLLALAVLGLVAFAAPRPADARVSVFFGLPGFALFAGPPVVAPPPVVYAPPVYYGAPYAYYGRPYYRPVYGPYWRGGWHRGWRGGWHRGWNKHGRW